VKTTPYSVDITWVVEFISFDTETYSVQYGSDLSLQDSSEVVMGSSDGLATNQVFSVNITGLTPFTTYYYIVWANNSVGNTKTSVMSFTTNETGNISFASAKTEYLIYHPAPGVAPGNFRTTNIASTSIMFQWDSVVDQANGVIRWYVIACDDDEGNDLMVSI